MWLQDTSWIREKKNLLGKINAVHTGEENILGKINAVHIGEENGILTQYAFFSTQWDYSVLLLFLI